MPKLDLESIEQTNRTTYPEPMASEMSRRYFRRLGPAPERGCHLRVVGTNPWMKHPLDDLVVPRYDRPINRKQLRPVRVILLDRSGGGR